MMGNCTAVAQWYNFIEDPLEDDPEDWRDYRVLAERGLVRSVQMEHPC